MAKFYYDSKGIKVELDHEIGRGGEGVVYACRDRSDVVGKIYHEAIAPEKQKKLRLMASLNNAKLQSISAWIVDTLHETRGGEAVGLLMPPVRAKEIHELYSLKSRRVQFPNSDWRFLVHAATNLAKAVYTVHAQNLVIGDVNHGNFVVLPDGIVKLIDCDSYHFEFEGEVYPCEVGMSTHTPPELQGISLRGVERLPGHDNFGLAVIIFQLLFLGRHPFAGNYLGKEDKTLEESIKEKLFAYGPGAASRMVKQPPGTLPLQAVSKPVARLFERAFLSEERPEASEWIDALTELSGKMERCAQSPAHYYYAELDKCPWCEIEVQAGVSLFPTGFGQPETTGFNLLTVEELLKSIKMPSKLALSPARYQHYLPASSEAEGVRRKTFGWLWAGGTLQVVSLLFLIAATDFAGTCSGTLLIISIAIALIAFSNRGVRSDLKNKVRAEKKSWEELDLEWRKAESIDTYSAARSRIADRLKQYKDLPQYRIEKLKGLREEKYRKLQEDFLRDYRIDEADIKGIGLNRTLTLKSVGIETAADIDRTRIALLKGFGDGYTQSLLDWRHELSKLFSVSSSRLVVTAEDRQALDVEILKLKAQYERELQDSTRMLRSRVNQLAGTYDTLRAKNNTVSEALAQAERNLSAVDVRLGAAAASVAIGIVLGFGSVIFESGRPPAAIQSRYGDYPAAPAPGSSTYKPREIIEKDPYEGIDLGPDAIPYDEILEMSVNDREAAARERTVQGVKLASMGGYGAAEKKLKQAVRYSGDSAEIFYELGIVLTKLKHKAEAAGAFENGIALSASYRDIQEQLGQTYIDIQDWNGAVYLYEGLVRTKPTGQSYYNLGVAQKNLNKWSEAIESFKKAADFEPNKADYHYALGEILVEEGRFIDAEVVVKRLTPLSTNLAEKLRLQLNAAKYNYARN